MFAPVTPFAGANPFNDWFEPDTIQRNPLGLRVVAECPFYGYGTFIYVKSNDAILKGSIVEIDESMLATLYPNTANLGRPFGVAVAPMPSGDFGWVQVEGVAVYRTNATVAADAAIGIAAAGILGTNSAGKQALGVRNRKSATATISLTNTNTQSGSGKLFRASGYELLGGGAFLGMALSGTGIPGSTVVAGLDPDGKTIYMGSAIGTFDRTATATGLVTVTGTFTGFGLGVLNNPHMQGAIT